MKHLTRAALTTILLVSLAAALACSSDGDEPTASEGAGASEEGAQAAADTGGQAEGGAAAEGEAYALKQEIDAGIEVTSPVFNRIRRIPKTHVCPGRPPKAGTSFEQDALTRYADRKNTSPPIDWTGVPDGTQTIAVMMDSDQIAHAEDPDIRFTHWLIWNLPPETSSLGEAVATSTDVASLGANVRQGTNDHGVVGYSGPVPIADHGRILRHQAQDRVRVPVPCLRARHGSGPTGQRGRETTSCGRSTATCFRPASSGVSSSPASRCWSTDSARLPRTRPADAGTEVDSTCEERVAC